MAFPDGTGTKIHLKFVNAQSVPNFAGGMEEKIYRDDDIGDIVLRRNARSRRVSVRVHPVRGVTVTVPYLVPYSAGIRFLLSKKKWVLSVMARQKAAFGTAAPVSPEQTEALRREAREYLPRRLAALASKYGFEYNRLAIKDNRSNWGSCSSKNNINLNLRLMLVPEHLRDYVMLHELCHLRYHDHGPAFHALLERLCADWFAGSSVLSGTSRTSGSANPSFPVSKALEKELRTYHPA